MPTIEERLTALESLVASITTPSHASVVNRMSDLLTAWQGREDEFRDWQAGTSTGGPNGDGYYPMSDSTGYIVLKPCIERIAVDANGYTIATPRVGAGPFTLGVDDVGKLCPIGNGSVTSNIAVRLPNLPLGSQIGLRQTGSGRLVPTAFGGSILGLHRQNHIRTAGIYAVAAVICTDVTGGNSTWSMVGDTSA